MPYHEDEPGSETNSLQSDTPNLESATASDRHGSLAAADEAIEPPSEFAQCQDIRIDRKDRLIGGAVFHDSSAIRAGIIVGVVIALMGLAWIIRSSLSPSHISSSRSVQIADSSAAIPDSKGDRFQPLGNAVQESSGEVSAEDNLKHFSSSTSDHAKPSLRAASIGSSMRAHSTGLQRHIRSLRLKRKEVDDETKPTQLPETRPTTIEGWTVREVANGLAALEGPSGIWRVKRGDAVPGLGRIDSIVLWGQRWIVATSRGLVSTP